MIGSTEAEDVFSGALVVDGNRGHLFSVQMQQGCLLESIFYSARPVPQLDPQTKVSMPRASAMAALTCKATSASSAELA